MNYTYIELHAPGVIFIFTSLKSLKMSGKAFFKIDILILQEFVMQSDVESCVICISNQLQYLEKRRTLRN